MFSHQLQAAVMFTGLALNKTAIQCQCHMMPGGGAQVDRELAQSVRFHKREKE